MIRAKEEAKEEADRIKRESNLQRKMKCYSIDHLAVQDYFKKLNKCLNNAGEYNEAIMQLVEVILFESSQNRDNQQL